MTASCRSQCGHFDYFECCAASGVTWAGITADELVARFESLGDNCEFGLVQRKLGAEPLGLLRFTFIELRDLVRGLRCGFEGLGAAEATEVTVSGKDQEYVIRDTSFRMTFHTWQSQDETDIETIRRQYDTRVGFLRRKLLEDVTNAEKYS